MSSPNLNCPVCQRGGAKRTDIESAVPRTMGVVKDRTHCQGAFLYECSGCGRFAVTRNDEADYLNREKWRDGHHPLRLSALLREQTIYDRPPYWVQFGTEPYGPLERGDLVPIDVDELLARWPRTVPERLDRMLCNLARLSSTGGHRVDFPPDETSLRFGQTIEEATYNLKCLIKCEWVQAHEELYSRNLWVTLAPKGWERFEEITRTDNPVEEPVFVAMWYGAKEKSEDCGKTQKEMKRVYEDGIRPAVEHAGYHVTRVDLVEHNEWIMDQVLGLIRLAPFVVADFTGHRNGVYFEAGFARGLGKTVIQTCEKDDLDKAHFDTRQLNHVLWKTPEELHERLYHRIIGSNIGRGPHPPASPGS